jgi:tetratricopeptide (TPR) repeat protein
VTDFGLARPETNTDSLKSLSETGRSPGTPAYMAPEQVEGKPLTPAADVYALGIVLYEMITGVRPFDGGSAFSVAARRLTEAPKPPSIHVPDLDPRWEQTILRCLARDAAARPRATEVVRGLRGETMASTVLEQETVVFPTRPPSASKPALAALALAAAVGVGYFVLKGTRPAVPASVPASAPSPAVVRVRRAVGVLPLKNSAQRADAAWLSTALAEMLATELGAGDKLRIVPSNEITRTAADLGIAEMDSLPKESLGKLRQTLGLDWVATGAYASVAGDQAPMLRLDLRVQDAVTADVLASAAATGTEDRTFDMVSRAGGILRKTLGVGELSAAQDVEVAASLPSNPQSSRLYIEGLGKLRQADAQAARELFEKAAAADPKHPMPQAGLATAWSALGYDTRAVEAIRQAVSMSAGLPRDTRLLLEGQLHEATKAWPKAIAIYKQLFDAAPDSVDHGVRLADTQTTGAKGKEALVTIAALRKLPAPVSDDPRIDLAEARALQRVGSYKEQQAVAARAAAKGEAAGARLIVASARLLEATALRAQGQTAKSLEITEQARALFEAAGDRRGVAQALERMAITLHRGGDMEGARKLFERAAAILSELGDRRRHALMLQNQASVLLAQGKLAEAERLLTGALATFREVGAKWEAAQALVDFGIKHHNRGELALALKRYNEALALYGEIGDKGGTALALTNIGETLFVKGDLEQSAKVHEEALATSREVGQNTYAAYNLFRLGEVFLARGDGALARDRYNDALALQEKSDAKTAAADTRVGLARVALEEGRFADAAKLVDGAAQVFRGARASDREALALTVLGTARGAEGNAQAAREAAERASTIAKASSDAQVRFAAAILDARLRAASAAAGDVRAALDALEPLRREARQAGMLGCELDLRLAQAEIDARWGNKAGGRRLLESIAQEARSKGYGGASRRASRILEASRVG